MDPLDYLRALRQRWKVIVACVLVALVAGWVTTPANPTVVATRKASSFVRRDDDAAARPGQ